MNKTSLARRLAFLFCPVILFCAPALNAETLEPERQAKVDARIVEIKTWAADPVVVAAVAAQNAQLPADHAAMTQEKWKTLTVLDPFVRSLTRNEAAGVLKARRAEWVAEAFLNDASGRKVAFLGKTSSWSHGTSAKHTKPVAGDVWQGAVELDESTGLQQVQVAVPVLHEGKPAGSLVVGIALSKLD